MVSGYRTFKRLLKMHYETFNTYEEAKNNPPHTDLWNRRPIVQWHWLCDNVYNDPTHMEISKKNSENRRRLRNLHCGGSRSYGLHTMNEAEEGRPLSIIDTWGKLHRTKDGGWISKDALDHVQKMDNDRHGMKMKLAAEAGGDIAPETIVLPIESEFQILRKELGYKGRKIIGVGAYPLMEARLSIATSAHANKNKIKDLEEENERLRSQIETLKASSSRGRMSSSRGRMLKASSSRGRN
ncbi:hypothetical protein M0R45_003718 [Rubus argutus]|uniref:Uncharacterized protein n=1 Tax=Rubus argutus TaxID=59490 RepID=A0AAW1YHM2_RUBAR